MKPENDLLESDGDTYTYTPGRGFAPENHEQPSAGSVRIVGTLVCGVLLLAPLCQNLFRLPLTYLAALCRWGVTINYRTGLIVMSDTARHLIRLSTSVLSLLIVYLLLRFLFYRPLSDARMFRRPAPGILPAALPILTACGVISATLARLFGQGVALFGILLDPLPSASSALLPALTLLIPALLRELIFRGALLMPLRRFGDGFAVVAAALCGALLAGGPSSAINEFLFGVAAGYFVVRSGSVLTALAGRLLGEVILYGLRLADSRLEASLALVISILTGIVLLTAALLAYLHFIRLDRKAFWLFDGGYPPGKTLASFCTALTFWALAILLFTRTLQVIQIIGW